MFPLSPYIIGWRGGIMKLFYCDRRYYRVWEPLPYATCSTYPNSLRTASDKLTGSPGANRTREPNCLAISPFHICSLVLTVLGLYEGNVGCEGSLKQRRYKLCIQEAVENIRLNLTALLEASCLYNNYSTMLHTGRSQVRYPIRRIFLNLPNPSGRTRPLSLLSLQQKWVPETSK
jgi:hypothetical protein